MVQVRGVGGTLDILHTLSYAWCMGTTWNSLLVAAVSPVLTIAVLMIWRYTDNTAEALQRLDTDIQAARQDLSRDIKETNKLLTDNLIELSGDVGSLKATSHTHTQP